MRNMRYESIGLITGMHRSGTTWLGAACSKASDTVVLHEPFNYASGVRGIPHWYPDPENDNSSGKIYKAVSQVISGRAKFRLIRSSDTVPKAIARMITLGGPDFWTYRKQINTKARHLILKDPFALRMSLWLSKHFNVRTIVLIRHPCSLYLSLSRMHWQTPVIADDGIFTRSKVDLPNNAKHHAKEFGEFWRHLYGHAFEQEKASEGAVKIIRHEDLCVRPTGIGKVALEHLGLQMNKSVTEFLSESSSGDVVAPPESVLHSMKRNSAELVHAWRGRLSEAEQDAIMRAAGPNFDSFYGECEFPLSR